MKYGDQIPFFRRELATLGRAFPALSFESFLQVMARDPSAAADSACRQFASTLLWPQMPDDVRLEVCLRLTAWLEWLDAEAEEGPIPGEIGQDALASGLIDYWREEQRMLAAFWKDWPRCP